MKKSQIIELAKKRCGWRWDTRSAGLHADMAWSTTVGQLFAGDLSNLDLYAKAFTITVVHATPRPYALLPVPILQTVDPANGVRHIQPICEDGTFYVPIKAIEFNLLPDSDAGSVDDTCGYCVKADRVEFFHIRDEVTELTAQIVPTFSAYDDNDDIPLPSGSAEFFFEQMVQSMSGEGKAKDNIFKK